MSSIPQDARVRLYAYVCECGRVQYVPPSEGYGTLEEAFSQRPQACRYVVAALPDGQAVVVDLYQHVDKQITSETPGFQLMYGSRAFADVDVAVAACAALYDTLHESMVTLVQRCRLCGL